MPLSMKTFLALVCFQSGTHLPREVGAPPSQGARHQSLGWVPCSGESYAEGTVQTVHNSANMDFGKVSGPPFSALLLMSL